MGRKPRFTLPRHPWHIVQRGPNRPTCLLKPADCRLYLEIMQQAARHEGQAQTSVLIKRGRPRQPRVAEVY